MNFFEHQDEARRKTGLLVLLFGLTVLFLVALVYGVCLVGFRLEGLWHPDLLSVIAILIIGTVVGTSLIKSLELRQRGGEGVAESLGGVQLHANSDDPAERRLNNVVEEMAIASGMPAPPIYVLQREEGINAFAAGWSHNDAVIGVTRGALDSLTRDELQGVVAHEFSHILNGDMRLNTRLIGVLAGITVVGAVGTFLMRGTRYRRWGSSHRRRNDQGLFVFGALLWLVGAIGVICGRLVRASVSRQREFLADASAVQYTRNPQGIGGALIKIGGLQAGSWLGHPGVDEASHMFFGNPLTRMWNRGFATHPPIAERVQRIDPGWDGQFPEDGDSSSSAYGEAVSGAAMMAAPTAGALGPVGTLRGSRVPNAPRARASGRSAAPAQPQPASEAGARLDEAIAAIGEPTQEHLHYAQRLLESIPRPLRDAAHEPFSARALIYALLLSREPGVRRSQLQTLEQQADRGIHDEVLRLHAGIDLLDVRARLPLLDTTIPALCELTPEQFRGFRQRVVTLIKADGQLGLFEWTLSRVLRRHLEPRFMRRPRRRGRYRSVQAVLEPCVVLLSAIAHAGHHDGAEQRTAFARGASAAGLDDVALLGQADCGLERLGQGLRVLERATPKVKQTVLQACAACASADGRITIREAELVRAIADTLECPVPPLLPS